MNNKDLILTAMSLETEINPYFSSTSLQKALFPDFNIDQVKFLMDSIIKTNPELLVTVINSFG